MRFLADLFTGLFLAVVFLAGFVTFAMGVQEPQKNGALAIAGAVLVGSTMIAVAITSGPDRSRE